MNKFQHTLLSQAARCLLGGALAASAALSQAGTITVINGDDPGVGFNDATPADPVGGNMGMTLGEQRQIVYKKVALAWGKHLPEGPPIQVYAYWAALSCTSTGAVLGSAGPTTIWTNFPNAKYSATWYPGALANTLAGEDLDAGTYPEIVARFNVNLGSTGCLDGVPFYLGLDGNSPPGQVDFATVLMHEVGHGLGFVSLVNGSTGERYTDDNGTPYPGIWEHFMYDNTAKKSWVDMTDAERAASAINPRGLVWTGENVTAGVPSTLRRGTPLLNVKSTVYPTIANDYSVGAASFGPMLSARGVAGAVARVIDQTDGVTGTACLPLDADNSALVMGKIALVDRGACAFVVKVKNAQNAGALAVVVADNTPGGPPGGLGGFDDTITIPSVRITKADGDMLKTVLTPALRTSKSIKLSLKLDKMVLAGADAMGRVMLYTPNPYQPGSSVSHFDTSANRNLLMEPAINSDLVTYKVKPPADLTLPLLMDIGY